MVGWRRASEGRTAGRSAARITFVYLAAAVTWVVFSDHALGAIVSNPNTLTHLQTFKGIGFVSGSATLIYLLLRGELRARERDQERLREAETRYRTLVEQIPAITYINAVGEDTRTLYMSPQVEAILGFTPQEWVENPALWDERLHPDDRDGARTTWHEARDHGAAIAHEYRVLARDGRMVWFRDQAVVLTGADGRPALIQGVMLDVTQEKAAERELMESLEALRETDRDRRRLLHRLIEAEERERQRIASDVHDGPLQQLASVRLRLGMLRDRVEEPTEREAIDRMLEETGRSMAELRTLLFELRPPALTRHGLATALREYLAEASLEAGFAPSVEDSFTSEPPPETAALAYRIAREAIANARTHARADRLTVRLRSDGGGVEVRIEDDGVGFDPAGVEGRAGHLGISDMRERAQVAGGWLRVESAPGRGTTVAFWIPVGVRTSARSAVA